jgi:hypothetical protein
MDADGDMCLRDVRRQSVEALGVDDADELDGENKTE